MITMVWVCTGRAHTYRGEGSLYRRIWRRRKLVRENSTRASHRIWDTWTRKSYAFFALFFRVCVLFIFLFLYFSVSSCFSCLWAFLTGACHIREEDVRVNFAQMKFVLSTTFIWKDFFIEFNTIPSLCCFKKMMWVFWRLLNWKLYGKNRIEALS